MAKPRAVLPKKVWESWFAVYEGDRKVGYDWVLFEPHADRTAWFERHAKFTFAGRAIDNRLQARLKIEGPQGSRPELTWCRYREAGPEGRTVEIAGGELPRGDLVLPSYLVTVVAAAAPTAPGEALRFQQLYEGDKEVAQAALVCHGPEEIDAGGERFKTVRFTLERDGKVENTHWVDGNRRVRKIDFLGPIAVLSTRAAATAT